ncbi:MAG: hypothetical protein CXT72_04140 [Methanobacteriota archaeon]|nr:MAG: hypothetical protein CXT72_04140 [Euryarchaeota archaeon]
MTNVTMYTSAGDINIKLYTDDCPDTTANFLKLVAFPSDYQGFHDSRWLPEIEGS